MITLCALYLDCKYNKALDGLYWGTVVLGFIGIIGTASVVEKLV